MSKQLNLSLWAIVTATFLQACNPTDAPSTKPYNAGVVVVNAGNFQDNNGSLIFLTRNNSNVTYDVFGKENQRQLAGSLSGYAEANGKGIILVDNATAGKDAVEIVDAGTFKTVGNIPTGTLENPRQALKITDTKIYVTCWDATGSFNNFYPNLGYIAVLDVATNTLQSKVPLVKGAESMALVGSSVYVGSAMGAGNTEVVRVDSRTNAIADRIKVGADPEVIGLDASNKLWIYAGNELVVLNTATNAIERRLPFSGVAKQQQPSATPSSFAFSADKKAIFFTYSFYDAADNWTQKGQVYSLPITATTAAVDKPFINRLFAGGLATDPATGQLYAGLIPSYKQAGYVFRYQPSGVLIDSVKAEIAPSKFWFR